MAGIVRAIREGLQNVTKRTRDRIKPQTTGTSKSGVEYNTYNLTKANPTTRAVSNRSRRQGRTEGAVALAVGATEAFKLGKRIAGKNLTNQEMIREYTEALQDDGASGEEVRAKVKEFKENFIKGKTPDVKFNKGGSAKGMKTHNYVAGGSVKNMMSGGYITKSRKK
jgi:hypothetical protein